MGYGGPVWHVSVAPRATPHAPTVDRVAVARAVLDGVGDAHAGEWADPRPLAYHLRRRLSAAEAAAIGPVVDIRGTIEAATRVQVLAPFVNDIVLRLAVEEAGMRETPR